MRTFGVEEELLIVDARTMVPLPAGDWDPPLGERSDADGHQLTTELQQEQIEVVSPPQTTLAGQLEAIRHGRALADSTAAGIGGRAVALPMAPGPVVPHLVPEQRHRRIAEQFRCVADEQLTCGFHVHVAVESRREGVAVLDRIRVWNPVLLALSVNSPFRKGADSGYASYRHQAWSRWPTAGPTEIFGTAEAYDRQLQALLDSMVPLDAGMLYYDARLSERHPTVEVRVADVCLDAEHAAVIAALVRALVETAAREWAAGTEAPRVPVAVLRAWTWQASRHGLETHLVDPATGVPRPAGDVVFMLLDLLRPVLAEYGEEQTVERVVADMLSHGTGAQRQRKAYAPRNDLRDVVYAALAATHRNQ
ncbi:carboxylate-amine ligase [Arthrobacter sp. KK5.5]|uniref:carboxylate-amine ligase n=1 Tax=Arthrobacter sp. KK5.5 TaxID=3373084 RepID=UPI003EE721D1